MKLYELAFASRLFRGPMDGAYITMRQAVNVNPNLLSNQQWNAVLQFLNAWGCRIPKSNFPTLNQRLQNWAVDRMALIPAADRDISSLTENDRQQIRLVYLSMIDLGYGLRFSDTAAAKTLHALRPRALPIWDNNIKAWFAKEGGDPNRDSGQIYSDFIKRIISELQDLKADVTRLGILLDQVPAVVGDGAENTLVKVVDEFYWITKTVGHKVPTGDDLKRWLEWVP